MIICILFHFCLRNIKCDFCSSEQKSAHWLICTSIRFLLIPPHDKHLFFAYIRPTTGRFPDLNRLKICAAGHTFKNRTSHNWLMRFTKILTQLRITHTAFSVTVSDIPVSSSSHTCSTISLIFSPALREMPRTA